MTVKEVELKDIFKNEENALAKLVSLACTFDSDIRILDGGKNINVKSIMGMIAFVADKGKKISVSADGPDEENAVNAICEYLS